MKRAAKKESEVAVMCDWCGEKVGRGRRILGKRVFCDDGCKTEFLFDFENRIEREKD